MKASAKPSEMPPSVKQANSVQKDKKERLAKALRRNLLRRKAAADKQE